MKLAVVFPLVASFTHIGSAMALALDHPARSLHGMTLYRRNVTNNATYDAIISATQSATGQQAIQFDIGNLTASTLSILNTFNSVAGELTAIDNQKLVNTTFSGPWATLKQQYVSHLSDSRNAAVNLSAFCQELSQTIAPFVLNAMPGQAPVPPSNATDILQKVIAEAQGLQSTALIVSQDFETLITNMVVFTASFYAFAMAEGKANSSITTLNNNLVALNATIASLESQESSIAADMKITALASAGALAFFPFFAPFVIVAGAATIAAEEINLNIVKGELAIAEASVSSDDAQIATDTVTLAQIVQANSTVSTISDNTIPSMTFQLGAFEDIWQSVESDLTELIQFVTTAKDVPLLAYEVLTTNASPLYSAISAAMLAYATGIQTVNATADVVKLPASVAEHLPLTKTSIKIQSILQRSTSGLVAA